MCFLDHYGVPVPITELPPLWFNSTMPLIDLNVVTIAPPDIEMTDEDNGYAEMDITPPTHPTDDPDYSPL